MKIEYYFDNNNINIKYLNDNNEEYPEPEIYIPNIIPYLNKEVGIANIKLITEERAVDISWK
ncbi:MAG TPA: hypothetical protein PKI46_01720 [Bacteroidales bacterium]|nr:hypothetical protein [Bacteroidales bacterium]